MDWLLIAELCNAVAQMEAHHEWDMTCGETGAYMAPIYDWLKTRGFPKTRAEWDEMHDLAATNAWGEDHLCDPLTDHETWDFAAALTDSFMNRNLDAPWNRVFEYIKKDLGAGEYPRKDSQDGNG